MTILLYTDASTKNGASCWAFKTSLDDNVTFGISLSTNTAAIETLAIIKGLETIQPGLEVMVICDFLGAVKTITHRVKRKSRNSEYNVYHEYRDILIDMCKVYKIDALWIASHCPNKHHLEVDQASKIMLQEYLNKL